MKSPRLALVLASFLGLAACGAPEQAPSSSPSQDVKGKGADKPMAPVLMPDVVTADQQFADAVEVKDDRLVIATAGHEEMIAKIAVGSVLAGDRSSKPVAPTAGSIGPNPYGFLRRVKSITTEGANTIIATRKASLDEYLKEGDIVFGKGQRSLLGTKTSGSSLKTKTLHLLDEDNQEGSGSGSASVEMNASLGDGGIGVTVSGASLNLNAAFDGYFKVRYRPTPALPDPPTGVSYKAKLTLDPQFVADIEISGSAEGELGKKDWKGPEIVVPLPSPVPVTLRLAPELECTVSITGTTSYGFNVRLGAHSVDGYEGDAGFDHFDLNDISEAATADGAITLTSAAGKVTGSAKCALRAVPAILIFDALGINGKIGPYVSINAEICRGTNANGSQAAFTVFEEHGLSGEFDGRVQIPLLAAGKDFKALGIELPLGRKYLKGDENSCEAKAADSCVGKADGLYCSELTTYGGYVCRDQQIDFGLQCAEDQKCVGGTRDAIQCQ
jgi:hypothetical protein